MKLRWNPETVVGPSVDLETHLGWLDLHAFADFHSLAYLADGTLILCFVPASGYDEQFRLGPSTLESVEWRMLEVAEVEISRPGEAVPAGVERSMEEFRIDREGDRYRYCFSFNNEAEIRIECASSEIFAFFDDDEERSD